MSFHETRTAAAQRDVANGLRIIARQKALIERLKARGLPTAGAERLLDTMQTTQRTLEAHLAFVQRQTLRDKPNLGR